MESITSLIRQLKSTKLTARDGTSISYKVGDGFHWNPNCSCLFYNPTDPLAEQLILHELGHALLGHVNYSRDIELLTMERAAWNQALILSKDYGVTILEDTIEDHLDTYRDWLHARSLCPDCGTTGIQAGASRYACPSCGSTWRVNSAKTCGLRRYKTK